MAKDDVASRFDALKEDYAKNKRSKSAFKGHVTRHKGKHGEQVKRIMGKFGKNPC